MQLGGGGELHVSALTDGMKAAAAATVLGLVAYAASHLPPSSGTTPLPDGAYLFVDGGVLTNPFGPEAPQGHLVYGAAPGNSVKVWATARGDNGVRTLAWMPPGAGYDYWRAAVCVVPIDGGADPGPTLMAGLEVEFADDDVSPCSPTDPQFEAWVQARADAPFPCACALPLATGACLTTAPDGGQAQAPIGAQDAGAGLPLRYYTLNAGTWSGAGCRPKACRELGGSDSWAPAGCPP